MSQALDAGQVRHLRLRAQGLAAAGELASGDGAQIVGRLGGVQAQEAQGAAWTIGVRHRGLDAAQIEAARIEERSIVRTWALRGTLHLVATADLGWLLPLVRPRVIRQRRRRYAQLDLSEERYHRAVRLMEKALRRQGPMTRAEMGAHLAAAGEPLEGQALYHALGRAGLEGVLCFGPDREGEETYVLLDEWASPGPALDGDAALTMLARRYVQGYGPVGPEDLADWSGLPLGKVRVALAHLEPELVPVETDHGQMWLHGSHGGWLEQPVREEGVVRLLPPYDPYVLGYRSRDLIVSPRHARRIHPGGGFLRRAVIVDGWAIGTWKPGRDRDGLEIAVELFEAPGEVAREALEDEARALGRFYGEQARLVVAGPE